MQLKIDRHDGNIGGPEQLQICPRNLETSCPNGISCDGGVMTPLPEFLWNGLEQQEGAFSSVFTDGEMAGGLNLGMREQRGAIDALGSDEEYVETRPENEDLYTCAMCREGFKAFVDAVCGDEVEWAGAA